MRMDRVPAAVVFAFVSLLASPAPARGAGGEPSEADPFPATYPDPAVPLLQLPARFRARRTSTDLAIDRPRSMDILKVRGAGCVRHLWFVFGSQYDLCDVRIEIRVDEAEEPQVLIPFRSFFGVLLGFEDYHVDSAAHAVFPNFTVTNDPHIPPKASPGWNFYLPIPFSRGCQITLHADSEKRGAAMVDWQQYGEDVALTPLRLHAQRSIALPASPAEPFPIAEAEGTGFLAGYVMGWRQKDHADMVFHTSGTRILIDGPTDPHVICGHNVEDDFGFSWGFNGYQTRWAGCPYRDNRGRNDQDGVFYRFFGPDPVPFRSSLIFTANARPDDCEAVSYFYKVPGSRAPRIVTPEEWRVVGPFGDGDRLDAFQQSPEEIVRELSRDDPPGAVTVGGTEYRLRLLRSRHGWLRLGETFQERPPYPMTGRSVYARATLRSDEDRPATLRLGLDNWAIIYIDGKQVALLDHGEEFATARIPISLGKREHRLLIKTNNLRNRNVLLWDIHCAVE